MREFLDRVGRCFFTCKAELWHSLWPLCVIMTLMTPDVYCSWILEGVRFSKLKLYVVMVQVLLYLFATAPIFFLPGKFAKVYFSGITFFLALWGVAELVLMSRYSMTLTGDSYLLLLNTNVSEAREFIIQIATPETGAILLAVILTVGIGICPFLRWSWQGSKMHLAIGAVCCIPLLSLFGAYYCKYRQLDICLVKVLSKTGCGRFLRSAIWTEQRRRQLLAKLTGESALPEIETALPSQNMVGVIVIGESAWREHLGIYGYVRNTTPCLSALKAEVLRFDNVIASYPLTRDSLLHMLTDMMIGGSEQLNFTLPKLLRAAGYGTCWISNQTSDPMSEIRLIASHCNTVCHIRKSLFRETYDQETLAHLEHFLSENHGPAVVFIHLIGSHVRYNERYPDDFGSFRNENAAELQKITPRNRRSTNEYDCSIEYTDWVLGRIIEILKRETRMSFMLYTSDHGETNGLDDFTVGRAPGSVEPACYEVPFLFWFSKDYREKYREKIAHGAANHAAPLQNDYAMWTILDALGIRSAETAGRSLFSSEYRCPRPRVMYAVPYPEKRRIER